MDIAKFKTVWANKPFNPKMKLSEKNDIETSINELEKPSIINAKTAGATTIISARRRPNLSEINPLSTLPNGWPIKVRLAENLNIILEISKLSLLTR